MPQFLASDVVLTHALLQFLSVPVQVQVPDWQVERSGQTLLHVPQFFASVWPLKHDDTVELGSRQEICGNAHVAPVLPLPPELTEPPAAAFPPELRPP